MNLYDRVALAPPVGAVMPEHELYLSYRLGPAIDGFGQIVIPTGVIEIVRSPRNGEAAIGRVVKMFGEVMQNQRLIAYDINAALVQGGPLPVTNGVAGHIRWIKEEPVLPSLQSYVVFDISRREGIATGDQIELYKPRRRPAEDDGLAIPELYIGRAQVLRVTPYGATAIITGAGTTANRRRNCRANRGEDAVASAQALDLGERHDSDRPVHRHLVLPRRRGTRRGAFRASGAGAGHGRPGRACGRRDRPYRRSARVRAVGWSGAADGPGAVALLRRPRSGRHAARRRVAGARRQPDARGGAAGGDPDDLRQCHRPHSRARAGRALAGCGSSRTSR